ncbi:MAG: hypothetical protein C5B48_10800 [Candidatus Rokuibacteriota bacterium]|nr:MAG: hypothetical protein C5B48_10800 [Candidatus Rokubacteria bacterium]
MFDRMKDRVGGEVAAVSGMPGASMSTVNDAIANLKALGLSVSHVQVGMGVVPEIEARLTGMIDAMDQAKIKKMIDGHRDNKTLVAILEALRTASVFKDQLGNMGLKGVEADVTLGLPPKVSVRLMRW